MLLGLGLGQQLLVGRGTYRLACAVVGRGEGPARPMHVRGAREPSVDSVFSDALSENTLPVFFGGALYHLRRALPTGWTSVENAQNFDVKKISTEIPKALQNPEGFQELTWYTTIMTACLGGRKNSKETETQDMHVTLRNTQVNKCGAITANLVLWKISILTNNGLDVVH